MSVPLFRTDIESDQSSESTAFYHYGCRIAWRMVRREGMHYAFWLVLSDPYSLKSSDRIDCIANIVNTHLRHIYW